MVDYGALFFDGEPTAGIYYVCGLPPLHAASKVGDAAEVQRVLQRILENATNVESAATAANWRKAIGVGRGGGNRVPL